MSNRPGPKYTFTFPDSARLLDTDPKTITIAPLTLAQELEGNKVAEAGNNVFAKVAMSICAIDGKAVDWVGGGLDAAIEKCSPKVRDLIMRAYLKVHMPAQEDTAAFLDSMATTV